MVTPLKKENLGRYCDYNGEKGHYTNDCYHLKRKLEATLESGKLNHLVKDARQKGNNRGRQLGNNNDRGRVINMLVIGHQSPANPNPDGDSGFLGEQLIPIRKVELGVEFGGGGLFYRIMLKFTVVRASSPYNIILGRTRMRELMAISSTVHGIEVKELEEAKESEEEKVLGAEKSRATTKEVKEWVKARIVRQVKYPTWIFNPVLVKKVDDTWRMCIDFKNLNSACLKDYYPLLEIDLKIKAVIGFPFKCFLDAYKGYHHIQMSEDDEEKTAFYTDQGTYCYRKMPFGLKNAGATYQRLVDSAFQTQLGRNLEAYVDDMVIKSKTK
ncbi:reverse transcriptase domain-containing protein [Tanacetum coccineum]